MNRHLSKIIAALLVTAILVCGLVAIPNFSQSADGSSCRIGASPSLNAPRVVPGSGVKLLTPPTVVGCGGTSRGSLELVAYDTSAGFCFGIDRLPQRSSEGGDCKSHSVQWKSYCPALCLKSVFGVDLGPKRLRGTLVGGVLSPSMTSVKVVYKVNGKQHELPAIVGQVTSGLMEKLRQTESFGLFATVLPVCVPPRGVRVITTNEDGVVLAEARGQETFPHPCHSPSLPPPPSKD